MTSIYKKVLGAEFEKLHPEIQKRFGLCSEDRIASIGTGVMHKVWFNKFVTFPFLLIGTWRNILFPQGGSNIPFTIENYAYKDHYGRETVTWIRTYQFPSKKRRFDATMIYSQKRNMVIDYLGTHQHLAVDIAIEVGDNGGLVLRSGEQRFYEKKISFKFPMFMSGKAEVCEWYDEINGKFKIQVHVSNKWIGRLFIYEGSFDVQYITVAENDIPNHVKPVREECRE
jgi:hypothetical protein